MHVTSARLCSLRWAGSSRRTSGSLPSSRNRARSRCLGRPSYVGLSAVLPDALLAKLENRANHTSRRRLSETSHAQAMPRNLARTCLVVTPRIQTAVVCADSLTGFAEEKEQ